MQRELISFEDRYFVSREIQSLIFSLVLIAENETQIRITNIMHLFWSKTRITASCANLINSAIIICLMRKIKLNHNAENVIKANE